MNVGERLRIVREYLKVNKKITQIEFAKIIGVNEKTLRGYEANKTPIGADSIEKLIKDFNLNSSWLFTGKGEMFLHDGSIKYDGQHTYGGTPIPPAQGTAIQDDKPITSSQVSDVVEKALAKALKEGKIKIASPTDPGIKRPLIRLAQCGTPAKIAYDTGELTTIASRYEYIDMVVLTEGDSMKEEGILPGAMVYIKKQSTCENGQIVLIANHDIPEEPRLILKRAKNNGKGMIFVNGLGDIVPLGENIEVIGVAKHVMIDF